MKAVLVNVVLGVALVSGLQRTGWCAEEAAAKALPTLLIKGEVVSLDANDPAASLLKVKDRYGFETPIFLTPETKMMKGEAAVQTGELATGTAVEVEYNFDVNTAKRHAVSVKVAVPVEAAPLVTPPAEPAAPAAAPEASTPAPEAVSPEPAAPPAEATTTPEEVPAGAEEAVPAPVTD